jgi:hypothetical protein
MAKSKVILTEEQKRRNEEILAGLAAEEERIFRDTRALQREWKSNSSRRRKAARSKKARE